MNQSPTIPLLRLTRFNGVELFAVTDARYNMYAEGDAVFGVFRLVAPDAVQVLEDTMELLGSPYWELVWRVPAAASSALAPGTMIEIPTGYDSERQEHIAIFSYVGGGEASEDNRIVILQTSDGSLRARITGQTIDVNSYDGSEPPTLLEVETEFRHDPALQRSF
jgi:hypothetical protein